MQPPAYSSASVLPLSWRRSSLIGAVQPSCRRGTRSTEHGRNQGRGAAGDGDDCNRTEGDHMNEISVDAAQRKAARVVGFCYLFAMVTAVFGFTVRSRMLVADSAVET